MASLFGLEDTETMGLCQGAIMRTSGICFSVIFICILIGGFGLIGLPDAAAISLDSDEEDMEDREDVYTYIRQAKSAADNEKFKTAEQYLQKAERLGIARNVLEDGRRYLSQKRKDRESVLSYISHAKDEIEGEDFDDAGEYLEKAERIGMARHELEEAQAYLSKEKGKWRDAVAYIDKARDEIEDEDFDDAGEYLEKAERIGMARHELEKAQAYLSKEKGKWRDAVAYIDKARDATDDKDFDDAEEYLDKAERIEMAQSKVKSARNYLEKKRQAHQQWLAKKERERRARQERQRQASSSSSSSSSRSSSDRCEDYAVLDFMPPGHSVCERTIRVRITESPPYSTVANNFGDHLDVKSRRSCIRGNYRFTLTAAKGLGCDEGIRLSGQFYLDGNHDRYDIRIHGEDIEVKPW